MSSSRLFLLFLLLPSLAFSLQCYYQEQGQNETVGGCGTRCFQILQQNIRTEAGCVTSEDTCVLATIECCGYDLCNAVRSRVARKTENETDVLNETTTSAEKRTTGSTAKLLLTSSEASKESTTVTFKGTVASSTVATVADTKVTESQNVTETSVKITSTGNPTTVSRIRLNTGTGDIGATEYPLADDNENDDEDENDVEGFAADLSATAVFCVLLYTVL